MLDIMRKHAKSWVVSVIIFAIAVVFVFWGAGSFKNQQLTVVAEVNGEKISVGEFQNAYRRLLSAAEQQYRDYLNEDLLKLLNLKGQAMDQLINTHLIYQQAKKMGIEVLDQDLQRIIAQERNFQVDGRFNDQRYQAMLSRMQLMPADYEDMIRQQELVKQVVRLVGSTAKVSEPEALDFYHFIKDKVGLEFVMFPARLYRDQMDPTDEEIKAYYEKNKEQFRNPAEFKVAYLSFRPTDLEAEVTVSDDDIGLYYETHLDDYRMPEQMHMKQILVALNSSADPGQVARAQTVAAAILSKVKENKDADFNALIEDYSEQDLKITSEDLGWLEVGQVAELYSATVSQLPKGAVSDLVRSDFGFSILRVEDRKPAQTKPMEEVKAEIKEILAKEIAVEEAASLAERTYDEITLSQNFEETAKQLNLPITTSDFFTADQPLNDVGSDSKFNQVASSLKVDEIGPLVELENGYYIMKLLEKKESMIPALEDIKAVVKDYVIDEQAMAMADTKATEFLSQAQTDWDAALAAVNGNPPAEENREQTSEQDTSAAADEADQPAQSSGEEEPAVSSLKVTSGETGLFTPI